MSFNSQHNSENKIGEETDCFSCRMVGGIGLLTAGSYVLRNSKVAKTAISKEVTIIFGISLMSLGFARLANVWPFQEKMIEKSSLHVK